MNNKIVDEIISIVKTLQLPKESENNAIKQLYAEFEETGTISNNFINTLLDTAAEKSALNIYTPNKQDNLIKEVQQLSIQESKSLVDSLYALQDLSNLVLSKQLQIEQKNRKIQKDNARIDDYKVLNQSLINNIKTLKSQLQLAKIQLKTEKRRLFKRRDVIDELETYIEDISNQYNKLLERQKSVSKEAKREKKQTLQLSNDWLAKQIGSTKATNK